MQRIITQNSLRPQTKHIIYHSLLGGVSAAESDMLRAGDTQDTGRRAHALHTAAAQCEEESSPSEVS